MLEKRFICPSCWQQVSVLVDRSVEKQQYIEDCEVCCRPLEISVTFSDNELLNFDVSLLEQ